jgi:hypothetical protein
LFNALLKESKLLYPNRPDILALQEYEEGAYSSLDDFNGRVERLRAALELRPPAAIANLLAEIVLPADAPDLKNDLRELQDAVALGLAKTTLLLAGSIAEALLLCRHPDASDRGPGLPELVKAARNKKPPLFGEDTLRHLETLSFSGPIPTSGPERRTRIEPNSSRIEEAIVALKLLCSELQNPHRQFYGLDSGVFSENTLTSWLTADACFFHLTPESC